MLSISNMCLISKMPLNRFFRSLEELSIRNNPFTEVPKALSDIPSLVSLDMSFTDVTELQVNTFSKNKKLKNLILDSLKYLYIVHDCAFCGLDALEVSLYFHFMLRCLVTSHLFVHRSSKTSIALDRFY